VTFLAFLVLVIWIYLFALHSNFWRVEILPKNKSNSNVRVAVIIPARNEATYIANTVAALLKQVSTCDVHLFIVDDNSSDGTSSKARAGALGHLSRVTILNGSPLPRGWAGKVWAMQQGWEAACSWSPDYVLLTDADIVHADDSLARLIGQAEHGRYDLVSQMVRLHCESAQEKLLIPALVFFFFLLYPPQAIADGNRRIAGAAGGCMLVRSQVLSDIRGFLALRDAVIDDCALAAAIKKNGGRIWLGVADQTHSVRPYDGFRGILDMIARTAFSQLDHSAFLLSGCVLGMLLVFVVPVALLFLGHGLTVPVAIATCVMMFATFAPTVRKHGLNPLYALSLPVAALFYTFATFVSALRYWRGTGGIWKGRVQDPA
jgi:hopene-associated glycosyltransferase HpnB